MKTTRKISTVITVLFAALAMFASCEKIDELLVSRNRPEVQIVIGDVSAARGGSEIRMRAGSFIEPQDVITVGQNSRVKFSMGANSVYVNENSLFAMAPPSSPDSGTIIMQNGDYYFAVEGRYPLKFAFGDITVELTEGTASLMIGDLGRLAEFFVISGRAVARRGNKEVLVSACKTVVFDAAGISEDVRATAGRGQTLNWLAAWVGGPTIRRAADDGGCYILPFGQIEFTSEVEDEIPIFEDETKEAPPRAPAQERMAPRRADTRRVNLEPVTVPPPRAQTQPQPPRQQTTTPQREVAPPPPPAPRRPKINIENVTGPARVHATEEFTLRAVLSGDEMPATFVWHVDDNSGNMHTHGTVEPRFSTALARAGDYIITVEARDNDGTVVAARRVRLRVNTGQIVLSAGGPYTGHPNTPLLFLGNARSRFSDIVRYEWFLLGLDDPIYSNEQNSFAHFTFIDVGEFLAIYKVTLADGSFATDTARVFIRDAGDTTAVAVVDSDVDATWFDGGAAATETYAPADTWTDAEHAPTMPVDAADHIIQDQTVPAETHAPIYEHPPVTESAATVAPIVEHTPVAPPAPTVEFFECPDGMAEISGGIYQFCIDRYEWPNRPGVMPTVNVNRDEAAAHCASAGKRLCTIDEWTYACRNGSDAPAAGAHVYPYGNRFDPERCNTNDNGGLAPTGSFALCHNMFSMFDMSGNVAEWVMNEGSMSFAYGGFHGSGAPAAACDSRLSLGRGAQFNHVGFRCCK